MWRVANVVAPRIVPNVRTIRTYRTKVPNLSYPPCKPDILYKHSYLAIMVVLYRLV